MRRSLAAIALSIWLPAAGVFAQAPPRTDKPAPDAGLKAEAAKPVLYPFALNDPITVHARALPVDFGGVVFSPLEAVEVTFTFDEKDNHLTAAVACTAVRVMDAVRTLHVALFDEHQLLLGTASASSTIKRFVFNNAPVSESVILNLDFGESATYKVCKVFQVSITGRGRTTAQYGLKDADELFKRLADAENPEGQWEAARALGRLGDAVVPRLAAAARSGGPDSKWALAALGRAATPAAAAVFDELLRSPDTPAPRRLELYALLSDMGPTGYPPLVEEFERAGDESRETAILGALVSLNDPRVGPFLVQRLKDEKRYYGEVRANIALALQQCNEKAAIPALIAALRDPSAMVRTNAARAVEHLTSNTIPVDWTGPAEAAWEGAPPEARELAVRRWEEWWKANSAKFGLP